MATSAPTTTETDHQPTTPDGPRRPTRGGWGIIAVLAVLLVFFAVWGIYLWIDDPEGGPEVGVTESDVVARVDELAGQEVRVTGAIDSVVGGHAVLSAQDLLYVAPDAVDPNATFDASVEGDIVIATGTVAAFDLAEAESALGVDLDDEAFAGFDGAPAIYATDFQIQEKVDEGE